YGKRKRRDLLLELDAAVHCKQHVVSVPHAPEQLAILDPGPTASDHSLNSMAVEFWEISTGRCSSRRTRIGHERLAREIKYGDSLFAPHRWELAQKLVERVAALQIVKQRSNRHPRADEDRRSSEDVGIAVDYLVTLGHRVPFVFSQYAAWYRAAAAGASSAAGCDRWAATAMASTRRLAAILAADVAGYSRLMGADEEGTHERLKAHLVELVDPKIREHHGRIPGL